MLRMEDGHVLRMEDGNVLRMEDGHVLRMDDGNVLMEEGHVLGKALKFEAEGHGKIGKLKTTGKKQGK